MKTLSLMLLLSGVCCFAASTESTIRSVNFQSTRPMRLLTYYKRLTDKLVVVAAAVRSSKKHVTVQFEGKTKDEAMKLIEQALLVQADVEVVPQEDGTLFAREIDKSKKAKTSEPTVPSSGGAP